MKSAVKLVERPEDGELLAMKVIRSRGKTRQQQRAALRVLKKEAEVSLLLGAHVNIVAVRGFDWDDPATWTAMLDRSPCGSGTCAVMACLHARGELALGERFVHEGIVGATFEGTLRGETTVGGLRAVLPSVTGRAWITQHCTVVVDPTDPFPTGFTVGDIWAS